MALIKILRNSRANLCQRMLWVGVYLDHEVTGICGQPSRALIVAIFLQQKVAISDQDKHSGHNVRVLRVGQLASKNSAQLLFCVLYAVIISIQ